MSDSAGSMYQETASEEYVPEPRPTIYVVDDDDSLRGSLARALAAVGFAVRSWKGANEFLSEFDPEKPGCLLTDVLMPGTDGLQLQALLAARSCDLPIVFMTASADIAT